MIFTDRTITVRKGESRIDEPIVVYRGDYELEVRFTILNSKFRFMSGTNLIESEKASYGQLAILTPYGGNIFSDIVRCNDGSVTFVLTADMLNQIEEVGLYSFQIRLMDYMKESRVSIPPIEFGIEVREPIASEDHDNSVNNAIVGYSIAKVVDPKEENVGDTFDDNGNYNKTKWKTGDRISQGKLNKIENAIDKINKNEASNTALLSKRIDNNFNVLDSTKADTTDVDNLQTQINDLVLGAVGDGNNAEVVQARGGYETLNSRLEVMDRPVDIQDVDQRVLNMLNKTSYLVLCPPIRNWEFDGKTLHIKDISSIYVYVGAKGYYHEITVNPEGITVNADQMAYVDLNVDSIYDKLDISVIDSPCSTLTHGINAFIADKKLPLAININGHLSGPLVDKLLPPELVDINDVTPRTLNMLNKTSYLVLCPPIRNWEFDGKTLHIKDISSIYVYVGAKGYYHEITVNPEGITVNADQMAYVDLNVDSIYDKLDISVIDSPCSTLTHGINAFIADKKLPLAININGHLSGPLVDKLLPPSRTIIDSRLYINVTSNSKVTIFKQSGEKSGIYYIGQDFVHSRNTTTNTDVWRLESSSIYTKNYDNSFTKFKKFNIINVGEWECALKEAGAKDFIGGLAHGDEIMSDMLFLLDGLPIDLTSNGIYTGNKITILENSVMNRVDRLNDKVAKHVRYYEITKDDIIITQKVEWLQSLTMDKSYLTMLPIARTVGNTEYGEYITNKGFKNNYFNILDLSYGHDNVLYENGVSEAVIWNDGAGYKVFAKVEILESNELPNASMAFSGAPNYNKIYFDYCGDGYKTSVGEIWNNKARYIIDYYGYVSEQE